MVSVIIPAFDEAGTVGACVAAAVRHPQVSEVIVVDDGSCDGTALAATRAGARVVRLEHNGGKADALEAGVRTARNDVMLFLDADVTGHTDETLSRIMQPVIDGRYEMYVGIHTRSTVWLNRMLHFFPIISGERALTRRLWESVPAVQKNGFQIEIAMNYSSKRFERGMGFELIGGTVHHTKEQKYGFRVGFWRRQCMMADVVAISVRLYIIGALVRFVAGLRGRIRRTVRLLPIVLIVLGCGSDTTNDVAAPAPEAELSVALERLLRGQAEPAPEHTWFSPETAGALRTVTVDSAGHAIVDFEDLRALIPNASSSAGSAMLLEELNSTVFSVDAVRSVDYLIEGRCERFWEWLQYSCQTVARP